MTTIGKYEIVSELGHGGMGIVYKGYDKIMEREVAIKVISEMMLAYPEIKERFYREARTAGKLAHDNITVIYEVGEEAGKPYIVMEYLPGDDLSTLLERRQQIPFLQKIDYAIQICRGLSFSHSRDIIHRDIKPANIRIVGGKVKIMDFGIAKPMTSNLTSTGAVIGTPYYMSPEQIQGRKVDKRSDIFSFGVLFYELLTGRKPFVGDEPTAVMYKIVHEEPEWIDDTRIDQRTGLRPIVMKLLAKNPDHRYQDLAEVAHVLEDVVADLKSADRKKAEELRRMVGKLIADSRTLVKSNKFKQAFDLAEQARRADPANTEVARLKEEITKAEQKEAQRLLILDRLQSAKKAIAAKKFDRATEFLQEILNLEPAHGEALRLAREAKDAITYAGTGDERFAETMAVEPLPAAPPSAPPAAKPPRPKTLAPAPRVRTPLTPERKRLYAIIAVVLLLVSAGILYRTVLYVPPVPTGYVLLNALPWGEVTRIVSEGGSDVPLKETTMTPCRLALPPGSYTITLTNPAFARPLVVAVNVKVNEAQEVRKKFTGFDYQQTLSRFQY